MALESRPRPLIPHSSRREQSRVALALELDEYRSDRDRARHTDDHLAAQNVQIGDGAGRPIEYD